MNLICLAALIAACGAAKLDRTYLPPLSAESAGGSPGSLQTPLARTSDQSNIIPPGGFINEHEGVVVEATLAGTRASDRKTGLGGPRESYGFTSSKVGDAAFRTTTRKPQSHYQFQSNGYKEYDGSKEADLSAFYQPPNMFKPGNVQIVRDYVSDVIKHHNDIGLNKFNYGFETNNGIKTSANGVAIDGVRAQGGFSYTGDDGKEYSVTYIADEAGFRPQGSHLPTPHPIPAAILEALEQNARDEAAGIIDDGSYDAKKYNVEDDYSQISEYYNNRLPNKLGHRPGFNRDMAIKQKQPSYEMSNFNEQFGFGFQTFKDKNVKPDPFNFHGGNRNDMKNINTVPKYEQSSSINSGFGSRNEYLPPNRGGIKYSYNVSPHSPQSFQDLNHFGKPHSSSLIPSSFGFSPGPISQGFFPLQSSSLASNIGNVQSTLSSFGAADKNYPSISSQAHNKPYQDSSGVDFSLSTNPSISQQTLSPSYDKATPQNSYSSIPVSGFTSHSSQPSIQSEFSRISPVQSSQGTNSHLETTKLNSMSTENFNPSQYTTAYQSTQYTNKPSSTVTTSFSSIVPTKQPEITLTTPLDETKTNEPSTAFNLNKSELLEVTNLPTVTKEQISQFQTSQTKESLPTALVFSSIEDSLNKNPQTTSLDIDKTQTTQVFQNTQITQDIFAPQRSGNSDIALNTQRPNYYTQPNVFTGQAQEADHSYIYKRPSVPFHTPVAIHQPNDFPNKPLLSYVDRVNQSMTTPLDSQTSTQYQSLHTNNNFPNPSTITTFSPSFPTLAENDSSKTTFQASSDITQASISKFPPIVPTVSSTFKKPSNSFDLNPLQQSESIKPILSKFTNADTTVTATTSVQSTALDNTESSQSFGNTGTTREIYEYNKPIQGLSSGTEKGEVDSSQKIDKPQITIFSTQFSQENPTMSTMSLEGKKHMQTDQRKPEIEFMQLNIKPEHAPYNYKTSKFFPSTMTTDTFATENQGTESSTTTLSQKPIFGLQTSEQFVNSDSRKTTSNFQQPYQETTTQLDYKQSTSNQGLFQTNPEQTHYTSITEKLSTQLPTNQPTQFETQSNTQLFDSKETTSNFQGPYQQTATQFDTKPSTSIPGIFQTNPEQTHYTSMTEKLSTQLPTVQPTQFETQRNTQFFDTKETTSNLQEPYQQITTQYDSKPSTLVPGLFQTNPEQTHYTSITDKLSTQLPTNQRTQFESQSNTQLFDSKETTSNFQGPHQQTAIQFDTKPSTSISGLFQTNSEQIHYTSMTEKLSAQLPTIQPTPFETQSNTQLFDSKETTSNFQGPYKQTATQFDTKLSTSIPGLFQTNPEQTRYMSMNEKLSTQLPTIQPTQLGTQSTTQFFDYKETTSNFQGPYQQTAAQFDSKPSTSIPGLFQTNPEQTHHTSKTEKLSAQLPTTKPTQFETQSNTQLFDSKETTSNFQGPYQQTTNQFDSKPSTSIPGLFQTNPEKTHYTLMTEKSSTQSPIIQPTQFETHSNTQFFDSKETTSKFQGPYQQPTNQFDSKPSTSIPGFIQTNPEQIHYTSMTDKLSTQSPTIQTTQFETQRNTQFFDSKETTSNFQGQYQQTATQFDSKLSTSMPALFQTNPEQTHYTSMTEKLSTQLPTNQPTQFETQSMTQFIDSKETTSSNQDVFNTKPEQSHYTSMTEKLSTELPSNQPTQFETQSYTQFGEENFGNKATTATQYQQSVTQFDSIPTTINMQQSQYNAQNKGKHNKFLTSSVLSTDEPTQFTVESTQEHQEIFGTKETTTSQFQETSQSLSTTFNEPSTFVPSTTQTASPPKTTQFGEIYDYTKPTQGLQIPSQNNVQLSQEKLNFVNHIGTPLGPQAMPIFQKEIPSQFEQQTPESQYNLQSNTQNIQEVHGQTGSLYTGSTSFPSTPQEKTTFDSRVSEQASTTGEIYEYTKPSNGLMTIQNVNIFQREKPTQFAQQTYFTLGPSTENFSTENAKDTTVQQSTQTGEVANRIFNTGSTPQDQNKQTLDQASTTGEIYEYTKPEQGLPSEKESVAFGQEIQMQSEIQTTKSDQDNKSQPTIGQSTQAPTTTLSISQTESNQNSQNQNTLTSQTQFTQEIESTKVTLDSQPKLAFHKACCNNFKVQNKDVGSSEVFNENNLKPNIGANIIEDNKNISHVEIDNQKETQANLPPKPSFSDLDPRKGSETYAGIGENFGGPRKPPSFDETGYHY